MRKGSAPAEMSFEQLSKIVKKLTPSEKMKLNDVIWDNKMELPEEHQQLVLGRIKKSKQDAKRLVDWSVASRLLRS